MKSARIRGVLFDFGGTLLDYRKEEVFGALLEEKGIRASPERIIRLMMLSSRSGREISQTINTARHRTRKPSDGGTECCWSI